MLTKKQVLIEAQNGKLSGLTPIGPGHELNAEAAQAYLEMVDAAKQDGISWKITDSYRPYEIQDKIFDWKYFKQTGKKRKKGTSGTPVAYPGKSNHGWGSAVDLGAKYGDPAHKWLTQNAARFGFSNPFKNPRTEPWHWEHKSSAQSMKSGEDVSEPSQKSKGSDVDLSNLTITQNAYKGEAKSNIDMIIDKLKDKGITNPIPILGILATIGKESGFVPKNEKGYCGTDDGRIVQIFQDRGQRCKKHKCDDEKFFDCVYGKNSGIKLGNTDSGDGYKYRGRGFNQITGRANYRKYGFESNPDDLNNPEGAADAMINFLAPEGSSLNDKFGNVDDAVKYFVTKNAGGQTSSMGERKANEVLANFQIGGQSSDSISSGNLAKTDDKSSDKDQSKLNVLDLMGLGGLNAMISLAKGDEEGFKKNIEKQEALQEQTDRIKDIIKKIL
jgi:predicted chitinase